MKAIVESFHSPDIDIEAGHVDGITDFGYLLQLLVGPADGPGEESFEVMVCSPSWIARQVREHGSIVGRHYLITNSTNIEDVQRFLRQQVEVLEADSWLELAEKIGRIGKWEFEDYSE